MADTNLTDIYSHVLPELPRCPKGIVLQAFRIVLREFLHRTQAYEYDLAAIDIVDGTTEYVLDSPLENTEIDAVMVVELEGTELAPITHFTVPVEKDVVILKNEPSSDSSDGLEIKVALKTTMLATVIETRLFDDFFDHWAAGVKARLMIQSKKAWTDRALAREYNRQYWSGIRQATNERIRGRTNKTTILKPRFTI